MCKSEEAQSAIGVLRNAFGMCKSEADRSESAIGVLRNVLGICKSEADRSESAIGHSPAPIHPLDLTNPSSVQLFNSTIYDLPP